MMEHCKTWWQRCNFRRMNLSCETLMLWGEIVYQHTGYKEYDNAEMIMIDHSLHTWEASGFTSLFAKAGNLDVMYKSILFYIDE